MITDTNCIEEIRRHAGETYPEECCGFLIGAWQEDGSAVVTETRRVDNVREELRERRYRISPSDFRDAQERAESLGKDVVGFYHSHPDHPAIPSQTDLEEATFPGFNYVIVSVVDGRPDEVASWALRDDRSGFDRKSTELIEPAELIDPTDLTEPKEEAV